MKMRYRLGWIISGGIRRERASEGARTGARCSVRGFAQFCVFGGFRLSSASPAFFLLML